MNFNSAEYALLLAVVLVLYYALRDQRPQNIMLLGAGLYFYASWDYRFLFLLMYSASVDYVGALGIVGARPTWRNGLTLAAAMIGATFLLCSPIDWIGLRSVLLPSQALTGGWIESRGWHGLFLADGNWRNCFAAFAALGLLGVTTTVGYRLPREHQRKYFLWVSMVVNLVLLGFFKYFDFFVASATSALAVARVRRPFVGPRDRRPRRHLVLHVPGDELHHRRVSRTARAHESLHGLPALRVVLSASGGRTDSTSDVAAAAAAAPADLRLGSIPERRVPDRLGALQEDLHRRQSRSIGEGRLRRRRKSHRAANRVCDLRVRAADLQRLQRLQ